MILQVPALVSFEIGETAFSDVHHTFWTTAS